MKHQKKPPELFEYAVLRHLDELEARVDKIEKQLARAVQKDEAAAAKLKKTRELYEVRMRQP